MADYMNIIFGECQDIQGTITSQSKKADDALSKIRSTMGITLTPGMFEGQGAEAFSQFILTKYIPDVVALIAAIAGMSTGMGSGLDMFSKADTSSFSQVQGIAEQFNFF
jgi:uncharacterized protein YukE